MYKRLIAFRHANSALAAGADVAPMLYVEGVPESVLAFTRENEDNKVLCIFNFSAEPQTITVTEAMAGDYKRACGREMTFVAGEEFTLGAWEYRLLSK